MRRDDFPSARWAFLRGFIVCTLVLSVAGTMTPALAADPPTERIKHAIFLVRPHYHDRTRELFGNFSDQLRLAARQAADREQAEQLLALAEVYRGHADSPGHGSGWLVRDADGLAWVVTNEHVVGQAEYVTLEWEIRAYRPIERCPVVYVDPTHDLAVIAVPPDALPPAAHGFELDASALTEGVDVAAAGFPSAFRRPTYQYTVGIVNNARFEMPGGQMAIHHSASIDPGSSGGPLMRPDPRTALGFRVVGVNTWGHLGRANVNLSIPAREVARALDEARAAWRLRVDTEDLKAELHRTAQRLARELGSGTPDVAELYRLVSYAMVARRGDQIFDLLFQGIGRMSPEEIENFLMRPVEYMRREMFGLFVSHYRPAKIAGIRLEEIFEDDFERFDERQTVRAIYSVSGHREEVLWVFEHGGWKIADATFSRAQPQQATAPPPTGRGQAAGGPAGPERAEAPWATGPVGEGEAAALGGSSEAVALADRAGAFRVPRLVVSPLGGALVGSVATGLATGLVNSACGGECLPLVWLVGLTTYVMTVPVGVSLTGRLLRGLGNSYWLQVGTVLLTVAVCMAPAASMPAVGMVMASIFAPILSMGMYELFSHTIEEGLRSGAIAPETAPSMRLTLAPVTSEGQGVRGAALGLVWRGY